MKTLLLSTLLLIPSLCLASLPAFPMAFWGTVYIDGSVAPAGTIVRVYDGSSKVGEVIVQEGGVYGYTEPTKQKLIIGAAEGTLTFTVQTNNGNETSGNTVISYQGFSSGETVNKDLEFITQTNTTSSGGGGGGGGGGKSKKKTVPASELVLGVSTTTASSTESMSEQEQKIALQKQIIVLLTQLLSLLQLQLKLSI